MCWDCKLELHFVLKEQQATWRRPCTVQVAHANAEWRQTLCEQYFDIWDKLQQPNVTASEGKALRAQLEIVAKETQNRSAVDLLLHTRLLLTSNLWDVLLLILYTLVHMPAFIQ